MLRVALSFVLAMTISPACGTQAFASESGASSESAKAASPEGGSGSLRAAANPDELAWATCGTCEWAIDGTKTLIIRPANGVEGTLEYEHGLYGWYEMPWRNEYFISASFEGKVNAPYSCCLFHGCSHLESVDLSGLDTSSVGNMQYMFSGCSSLKSVDLSGLDTSSVINMSWMFSGCSSLESIDLTVLDTSFVKDASNMLDACPHLKSVIVPEGFPLVEVLPSSRHWLSSVDEVIYQSNEVPSGPAATYTRIEPGEAGRVYRCGTCEWLVEDGVNLVVRPLGGAATGELGEWNNVGDWYDPMLEQDRCSPWANLPIASARFEGRVAAPSAEGMFYGCSSLRSVDLSGLDASSVENVSHMFERCSSLESLDPSGLISSNVTNMSGMFDGCSSLETLDLSGVYAPYLLRFDRTFRNCESLESIVFTSSRFSRMESMEGAFEGCSSLRSLDLSGFDTSKVTDMGRAFARCGSLEALDLSVLDTSCLQRMNDMFQGCDSLRSLVLPDRSGRADYTTSMFGFACGESFRLTVGRDFDTGRDAGFPRVRAGHYLDRVVTGRWVNVETGEALDANKVPSKVAATYAPEVVRRDLGASVRVQSDSCPTQGLRAEVVFGNGDPDPDPELELYCQWFDAGSDQPVTEEEWFSGTCYFRDVERGGEYYCVVADGLGGDRNELRSEVVAAEHTPGEEWGYDDYDHWKYCAGCWERVSESKHTFGEWEAVPGGDGEMRRTCAICGFCQARYNDYPCGPFGDVFISTPHADDILYIADRGITAGFPDGTFRPYDSIARCDMAAFLYRLAGSPDYEVTDADMAAFSDVDAGTPHFEEICWLASTGISTGYPDGTFRPYANVARCDMAAFLQRLGGLLGVPDAGSGSREFADVGSGTPHADAIAWLSRMGISQGFAHGEAYSFHPYENVARCDMAAFLRRMWDCCR